MEYLEHHGILGQKWGVRRYQNPDGTLTSAGKSRYRVGHEGGTDSISSRKGIQRRLNDLDEARSRNQRDIDFNTAKYEKLRKKADKANTDTERDELNKKAEETRDRNNEINKRIKEGKDETAKLLEKAEAKGWNVNQKEVIRDVVSGKRKVGLYAGTGMMAAGLGLTGAGLGISTVVGAGFGGGRAALGIATNSPDFQYGTKYKVKK